MILLNEMIDQDQKRLAPDSSRSDHETFFAAKQYLRHYKPTNDDLLSGIVDGRHDGGIDAAYIFVNALAITDDVPVAPLGRNATLDLFIFQVKNSRSFGEDAINKLSLALPQLLDFGRDEQALSRGFNPKVIEITRRFLAVYRALEMPSLRVYIVFVSLKADHVHPSTREKSEDLERALFDCFRGCAPSIDFVDAADLADMARDKPTTTRNLALAENPISTDTVGGYIAVVKLKAYEDFITSESGEIDASLFEANVRDYEGDTSVNRSIQDSLDKVDHETDFWWLNNGVTIVANRVQPANKLLELDSPQVVNGLQTSNEIYKRSRRGDTELDQRSLLVKVIQATNPKVRDRIIRATNSQTALGPSALRSTDKVQRQIEEYLAKQNLYYERRRNFYQNRGIPLASVVSIDQMGQALLATLVQMPHVARGSLSKIFEEDLYDLLFSPQHPVAIFSVAINVIRKCQDFLKHGRGPETDIDDFCYHLAMLAMIALTRRNRPSTSEVAKLEAVEITHGELSTLMRIIESEYTKFSRNSGEVLLDRVAKSEAVTKALLERGRKYLLSTSTR
ncbi:hypothetical protein CH275_17445 [Rhodococcus sp. 06-235-1A]|nr:hypothetical protein CH275_17445 [Rhodococcus sp. 06-235-1A]